MRAELSDATCAQMPDCGDSGGDLLRLRWGRSESPRHSRRRAASRQGSHEGRTAGEIQRVCGGPKELECNGGGEGVCAGGAASVDTNDRTSPSDWEDGV